MKNRILVILLVLLVQCKPNLDYELHGFTEKIIVEGVIASGEFPKVYLSLNIPLWQEIDSVLLLEKVIRTAKVTISSETETEILTSFWDKENYPPYVYRATKLKGEEGKTYKLEVTYSGYTVEATTTIPKSANILSFTTSPSAINDSLFVLQTQIKMDSTEKKSYRIFTMKIKDGAYAETKVIYNENLNLEGTQQFLINPTPSIRFPSYNEGGYFLPGDSIFIKIMTIDSVSTNFFKAFSVNTGVGKDIDIAQIKQLNSNISAPGFGIWYGAGIKKQLFIID